jgi:predicted TIM-barrel fold metal-dependent hydrolase
MNNSHAQHIEINKVWLDQHIEEAIDPGLEIVDSHHHLWDKSRTPRYMLEDLLQDLNSGHNICATVFVECRSMYRASGDPALRSVGETEFANGVAAMSASGDYGPTQVAAAIVASVDLRLGNNVVDVLEQHKRAGGARFRGIRHIAARDSSPEVRVAGPVPPSQLLADTAFRAGFSQLAKLDLSFDAWVYHPQLGELADLCEKFPDTQVVINHAGGPIGIGPYKHQHAEAFRSWQIGLRRLAALPSVYIKLGGLGMKLGGFEFHTRPRPPSSVDLAESWTPYIETCLELFGTHRCMFESNFPVEKGSCSYGVLWNSFKRMTQVFSPSEKRDLFSDTATRFYKLQRLP